MSCSQPPVRRCWIGLDLADKRDYTAIAVIETDGTSPESPVYRCIHLDHWQGIGYAAGIEKVRKVVDALDEEVRRGALLVMDATGPGGPLVEDYRAANLGIGIVPVTFTFGIHETRDERDAAWWHVPKGTIVATTQKVTETGRLKLASRIRLLPTAIAELKNFRYAQNAATGNMTFSAWREADHDDLVFALALPLWLAEKSTSRHDPKVEVVFRKQSMRLF